MTQAAFAAQAGVPQPMISMIIKGTAAMPISRIKSWAVILNLSTEERKRFALYANLTQCEKWVAEHVAELEESSQ